MVAGETCVENWQTVDAIRDVDAPVVVLGKQAPGKLSRRPHTKRRLGRSSLADAGSPCTVG
jgi:hypothetical protein